MSGDPTYQEPDPDQIAAPLTAAGIADQVRRAMEAGDLEQLAPLLSLDVRWGPPGSANPPCKNRRQVLSWYARAKDAGRSGTVTDVEVHANALLVGLRLDDGQERWQVLRVGPEGINDIRGFEDRTGALAQLGT